MPFVIDVDALNFAPGSYANKWGTQCAALVQLAKPISGSTNPPETKYWRKSQHIKVAQPGQIERGTAIATFTAAGTYPTKTEGARHAAIYLSHDEEGVNVIDQWHPNKPAPGERKIFFSLDGFWWEFERSSNSADHLFVIEVEPDF